MPRFLTDTDTRYFEELLNDLMERYPNHYRVLYNAYNSFEPQSNTAATVEDLAAVVARVDVAAANSIRATLSIRVRTSNYPSGWDQQSLQAKNQYVQSRLAPHGGNQLWICPGHHPQTAHVRSIHDATIDHIVPVAVHWNQVGHNSDRITRANWYYDTSNHAYLCQSCNSSRGSGGIFYRGTTGSGYRN